MDRDPNVDAALDLIRAAPQAESRSAVARIHEDLRQRILSLELAPGAGLGRADLARHYQVSVTPVRDALQLLEQDGLIRTFPQSRTLVTRIDLGKVREAHLLRVALETEIVRRLAEGPGPADLAQARGVVALQDRIAGDPGQLRLFQELDEHFHAVLFRQLDLADLHRMVRSRAGHLDRVRRLQTHSPEKIRGIVAGHAEIVEAIARRDPQAAMAALRAHLHKPDDWAETYRRQHPDFFG